VSIFEYRIYKHQNRTQARQGENSFHEWCKNNGLGSEGFSVVAPSDKVWKGRPVTFYIASYGYYQVQGGWMVYIAYRGDVLNHVRQHSWIWDGEKADPKSYKLDEFINI
jgi:hypothetical protein